MGPVKRKKANTATSSSCRMLVIAITSAIAGG